MPFSFTDKHIIVNYHYVREPSEEWRGIHPCSPGEFGRQVRFLSENFRITGIPEVFEAARSDSSEKLCALTFDDGLKDNFENALPILEEYDVKGTFFPIGQVFEGSLPTTHRSHIILSKIPSLALVDRCNAFLKKHFPECSEKYRIPKDIRITKERKIFDDIPTANFKETIGILPHEMSKKFMDVLCDELRVVESDMMDMFFMTKEEIQELARRGHSIGSHAYSHNALDTIERGEVRKEIAMSKKILTGILGEQPTLFAYPQSDPSQDIFGILKAEGFTHAAIVIDQRAVQKGDNPLLIPRYDTNALRDFLSGQHL